MAKHWFAVWVLTGKERDVYSHLAQIPQVEALLPREPLWERREGEWERREHIVFPGYVFLRCAMNTHIYYRVREIPGVIGWLGKDTTWPGIVPDEQMAPFNLLARGESPEEALTQVKLDKRNRRGYGQMTLCGQQYKIPFNIYKESDTDRQPEESAG